MNGAQTSNYTIQNSADPLATKVSKGDTVVGLDGDKGKIMNTQGTELPSTGGPGTNMIYLLGIILTAIGASGFVMKKQRKKAV